MSITPAPLTVTGETAANKVYDGTTTATLSGGVLSGVFAGDAANLTLTEAGLFVSKNAGTGIAVTVADILGGTAAGNYTLTQPAGITANITPLAVTVTGEAAANKVYDATTTATLSGGTLNGVLAGDASTVNLVQSGNFATKNIGTGIAVTATDSLTGANALNYTVTEPTGLTANITPVTLTVTGEVANNKAYDGTTNATLSGGTLVGVVAGDAAFGDTDANRHLRLEERRHRHRGHGHRHPRRHRRRQLSAHRTHGPVREHHGGGVDRGRRNRQQQGLRQHLHRHLHGRHAGRRCDRRLR